MYEASGRVGGRMFTNTDYFAGGQVAEWGGELIDTGHRTIRRLAQRFHLPLDDLFRDSDLLGGGADLALYF